MCQKAIDALQEAGAARRIELATAYYKQGVLLQDKYYRALPCFKKALELGFSYAITIDADGQHYPEDIPKFLEANRQHPHALIIGSRRMEGSLCLCLCAPASKPSKCNAISNVFLP